MQGITSTIYFVADIEKARDWYAKIFDEEPYFEESFYVGFDIGGHKLGLHPSGNQMGVRAKTALSYWDVKDIQTTYSRMLELGAQSEEAPNNVGGEIVVAAVKDPWNNSIGLIHNPHFKLPE